MFSYPSSDKLHLGHWYNYAPADTIAKYKKFKGHKVFQPMGFDSFGLPAENYAIKTGISPKESTATNIAHMRDQLEQINGSYNWDAYAETSSPQYYKWTQWIFSKLFQNDLVYKKKAEVNYCHGCETVLANEQCKDDACERCGCPIELRELEQWFVRTTKYKDRLLDGLKDLDWPEKTKTLQRNRLNNLRDWCISRQRYWGAPIPIVYDPEGEAHTVEELPWLLPTDISTGSLKTSEEFKERVVKTYGEGWTPEFDTMDTFMCSSFYFVQYIREAGLRIHDYLPVDLCVGGVEHADAHLIYARFMCMFLHDIGVVPCEEPFKKVFHQGMITKNGSKMAKSKDNAVDPSEFVEKYGSDALRMHLMFMGPYDQGGDWNDKAIVGMSRFLDKVKSLMTSDISFLGDNHITSEEIDEVIGKITVYLDDMKFNLAIATFMKSVKAWKGKFITKTDKLAFLVALAPFAPKTCEGLWETVNIGMGAANLWIQPWPVIISDEKSGKTTEKLFAIQVNGKFKGSIRLEGNESIDEIRRLCAEKIKIGAWINSIHVPDRLMNFVTEKK